MNERNLPLESLVTLVLCDFSTKARLSERKEKAISCFLHSRDETSKLDGDSRDLMILGGAF